METEQKIRDDEKVVNEYNQELFINLKEDHYLMIKVFYDLGGYSYLTGKSNERGIYLIFRTIEGCGSVRKYSLFGEKKDFKALVKPLKRYNEKQFKEVWEKVKQNYEELFKVWNREINKSVFDCLR